MKFAYKKYEPEILRPVIPITLTHKTVSLKFEALVDSGSDISLFDAEIAEHLGLKLFDGVRGEIQGLSHGTGLFYFLHEIIVMVNGAPLHILVGFMPNMPDFGYGILGQRGFFEQCLVLFDRGKETIEISLR